LQTPNKATRSCSRPRWASATAAGLLALGLSLCGSSIPAFAQDNTPPATTAQQSQPLVAMQSVIEDIAQKLDPAVVHIQAKILEPSGTAGPDQVFPFGPAQPGFPAPNMPSPQPRQGVASGSGIIINPDGMIITNRHVVEGAKTVLVTLTDHRSYSGVVYSDPNVDLAVVKINATGLPSAKLADTSHLRVGQFVLAIGYPFDVGQTVSLGIVSALGRSQTIEGRFYPDLIQTDASINPGNSGGALVDLNGDVIGINTAIAGEAAQSAGIGFAIPANTVRLVYPQLASTTHKITNYPPGWIRGKLGVEVGPVTPDVEKLLGTDEGAVVSLVQPDSPAAQAGVQVGDVITRVNDHPIRDASELVDVISNLGPNQKAVLDIIRNKKPITKTVITGSFNQTASTTESGAGNHLGLSVTTLTPDMESQLKLPDNVKDGAVVTSVAPGSAADGAGIQQGDVIFQVNDTTIHTADDYNAAVAGVKPGDSVGVKLYRADTPMFLVMQAPDNTP